MNTCPSCGGEGTLLGQLGKRIHYRCRSCGIDFSSVEEPTCRDCGGDSQGCIYCNECAKNHPYDYVQDDLNFDAARERGR
jgi:hypothetical protein